MKGNDSNASSLESFPILRNTLHHDSQYMMQCIVSLENQLTKLISLIEENNQFIKSMEQQQNQVCAPAGGSVIVRM